MNTPRLVEAVATGDTVEEALHRAIEAAHVLLRSDRPPTPRLCGRIKTVRAHDGRIRICARVRMIQDAP
jgi:hypothetical protein